MTQERVTLETERKRCLDFLRDKQLNLPSHLQQNADILSTEEHLERINKKLEKIQKTEEKAQKAEAKKIADSLKMYTDFRDRLYDFRLEVDELFTKLHHTHKRSLTDIKQTLNLSLQNYTRSK